MSFTIHEIARNDSDKLASIYDMLRSGDLVVLRQVPEVLWLRDCLQKIAVYKDQSVDAELNAFFTQRKIPSLETIAAYGFAVKSVYRAHLLSALFSNLICKLHLPGPVALEGGIQRMCLPSKIISDAQHRKDLFGPDDFKRVRPGAEPEIFMGGWSPPHRDIGRPHLSFQLNFWFPLFDITEEECLVTFPESYHDAVPIKPESPPWWETFKDLPIEQWGYGQPARIALNFGDVLLFHGEMLHCSPHVNPDTPRLSYDFRVSARAWDDNQIYREGFLNLSNFLGKNDTSEDEPRTAIKRAELLAQQIMNGNMEHIHKVDDRSATVAHNYQYHLTLLTQQSREKLTALDMNVIQIYDSFPFAEDRYINFAKTIMGTNDIQAKEALEHVLDRTNSYFWAARTGDLARQIKCDALASRAYNRAVELARSTPCTIQDNPLDYASAPEGTTFPGRLQPYPAEFADAIENLMTEWQAGKSNDSSFLGRIMPWAYDL